VECNAAYPLSHQLFFRFHHRLQTWTAVGRLRQIAVPVFLINGRDDKVTSHATQPIFLEVPKIRWVTMDKSSHMPFWEERERYMQLVDAWLRMPEVSKT
jgi:pimeloyl-ACP methyl ester carboxylesterase